MAYESTENTATITCDKCNSSLTVTGEDLDKQIFDKGWTANFNAKKYVHICYECQTKKQKETTDWMLARF